MEAHGKPWCWTLPPRPVVETPVLAALRGEPVPSSGKPDVAAALAAIAPLRAAREALPQATTQAQAMMAVFWLLAVEALAPELLREGAGGVRPAD